MAAYIVILIISDDKISKDNFGMQNTLNFDIIAFLFVFVCLAVFIYKSWKWNKSKITTYNQIIAKEVRKREGEASVSQLLPTHVANISKLRIYSN